MGCCTTSTDLTSTRKPPSMVPPTSHRTTATRGIWSFPSAGETIGESLLPPTTYAVTPWPHPLDSSSPGNSMCSKRLYPCLSWLTPWAIGSRASSPKTSRIPRSSSKTSSAWPLTRAWTCSGQISTPLLHGTRSPMETRRPRVPESTSVFPLSNSWRTEVTPSPYFQERVCYHDFSTIIGSSVMMGHSYPWSAATVAEYAARKDETQLSDDCWESTVSIAVE